MQCDWCTFRNNLTDIASLIKEISGKNFSVINSTDGINKAVLYSWNNDIGHVSEDVLYGLDRQIEINVAPFSIGFWEYTFPSGVSGHIQYIPVYLLIGSSVKMTDDIRHTPHTVILFCCWMLLKLIGGIYGERCSLLKSLVNSKY